MKRDKDLRQDVQDELKLQASVKPADIGVSVKDGIVTLTGHIPTYAEKSGAENAARRVDGVRAVVDELEVESSGIRQCTDEGIAQACLAALQGNYTVRDFPIKLVVSNGWVTLAGEVEWPYQKEAAASVVCNLSGVIEVFNNIAVKAHVLPSDVNNKIEAAFKRSAQLDARRIRVEVLDGRVILHGSVRSDVERDEAHEAALTAPGVTSVDNQLTVLS